MTESVKTEQIIQEKIPDKQLQKPVVGCISADWPTDDVYRIILRAQVKGYHVLILCDEFDDELSLLSDISNTTVIATRSSPGNNGKQEIIRIARLCGFPGVIYHERVDECINFEKSAERVYESDEYLISAAPLVSGGQDNRVVVGIPVYNEEVGIGSVVLTAKQHADKVVVVDDGSHDHSIEIAEEAGATVLTHEQNMGKGAAIQTFFDYLEPVEFDAAILLDGDGQHSPADIPDVVGPILNEEADLVIGSRYLGQAEADETPRYRRVGQRVLDMLTIGTSQTQVSDSQSGFRALSPSAVENLSITADNFGVESEMINEAADLGLTIEERPIKTRYEGIDSQTQNPLRHGLSVVTFILHLVRDRHPLLFFGIPGIVLTILGIFYAIDGILIYQPKGSFHSAKAVVSGFLLIIGTLSLFTGFILNQIQTTLTQAIPEINSK